MHTYKYPDIFEDACEMSCGGNLFENEILGLSSYNDGCFAVLLCDVDHTATTFTASDK